MTTYTASEMREMAYVLNNLGVMSEGEFQRNKRAAQMLRQAADAMEGGVYITHEMNDFLHGSGAFKGKWFGELHPHHTGAYWWRRFLPASKASADMQDKGEG